MLIRFENNPETSGSKVIRCPQSKTKLVWGMPLLLCREFMARKVRSLPEKDNKFFNPRPTTHAQQGRACMLLGYNEYASEFRETTDYVLVRPIFAAQFFQMVCKLGGIIPLAPGLLHNCQ